ncbi:hypothetical protein NDN01_24075 [Sphingomonas sp. QA11]|uniref:hypothetical protein n=1 Tax=Sphingomonas sp. QA11 TaxID=2950605 RepID=UPI00234B5878|nr:hypothetical protein [Sphingomonas sp. QA11]WCM27024.1 hypothetical protein NDN01_24075 [Sphingomonas sp. QA11]
MKLNYVGQLSGAELDRLEARTVEGLFDEVCDLLDYASDDALEDFLCEMDGARANARPVVSFEHGSIDERGTLELDTPIYADVAARVVLSQRWQSRRSMAD